jgi:hypothetical protein
LVIKPQLHVSEPTLLVIIEHAEHPELRLVGTVQQMIKSNQIKTNQIELDQTESRQKRK